MSSDWAETKVILHELEQLFNRDDDIKDIMDIKKMEREIELQCSNKLKDAKEIIKGLTLQLAVKEAEILAPSQSEHQATLAKLSCKENVGHQLETLSKMVDAKRQNALKLAQTGLQLKERSNEFTISSDMADSRTAYAVSLYAKISNITWDYSAPAGKLAGCIGNNHKKELKSFVLDSRNLSSFEMANSLWGLIGESLNEE